MRRLGALLLCLGLTAPALAADPPPAEVTSVPWYRWLFLGERAKPAPAKPAAAKETVRGGPATPTAAPVRDPAARTLADEHRIFLERLKSIDKIRKIANEQGDEELLKKTYDLEEQAEEVFKQRTAQLKRTESDRASLERGRDDRPATAERPAPRRRTTRGEDR
jgi:pyruvate/2-oxoglutarate dehydrogenase complex dihydrolipoamide acyltransferase (E2) component